MFIYNINKHTSELYLLHSPPSNKPPIKKRTLKNKLLVG